MTNSHEDFSREHEVKGSSNRSFGLVFAGVFALLAFWPLVSGGAVRWWCAAVAMIFLALSLAAPGLLALPNRLWMRFGLLLNRIITPVALGILFYLAVTPVGMLMRMVGADHLRLRRGAEGGSYWIKRDPPGPKPDSLNHQF